MILDSKGSLSPVMKAKWPIFKLKTKVECHSGISETFKVLCLPFESCIANNCLYVITNNTILQPKKIFTTVTLKTRMIYINDYPRLSQIVGWPNSESI